MIIKIKSPVTEGGGHRASGHLERPLAKNIYHSSGDVKKKVVRKNKGDKKGFSVKDERLVKKSSCHLEGRSSAF